jgi:hypothetical protein
MDVVYVVGPSERNDELRFSLRSLAAHLPHDRVWIAGRRPRWVSEEVGHIPVRQTGSRWRNSTVNLRAACEHPEVSGQFLYVNDDMFLMEPISEVPVLHRGPLEEVLAATRRSLYRQGAMDTAALMRRLGVPEPYLSYELHIPLPVEKAGMLEALDAGRALPVLHKRTLYGNLHGVGGEQVEDVKVRGLSEDPPEGPWLSSTDAAFHRGEVGRRIKAAFPDVCRYEVGYQPPDEEPEQAPQGATSEPQRPAQADRKAEWVDWAVVQGADRAEAESMTKADLVETWG